jgi:hypothetical protein
MTRMIATLVLCALALGAASAPLPADWLATRYGVEQPMTPEQRSALGRAAASVANSLTPADKNLDAVARSALTQEFGPLDATRLGQLTFALYARVLESPLYQDRGGRNNPLYEDKSATRAAGPAAATPADKAAADKALVVESISNYLKSKHDTVKNTIQNVR